MYHSNKKKHKLRSGSEDRVEQYLADKNIPNTYEKNKYKYTVEHTYTPDFNCNGFEIEVKGRFMPNDRKKLLAVREQNPGIDIRLVFDNPLAKISKASKTTYASWCDKYGFLWSRKIPDPKWFD